MITLISEESFNQIMKQAAEKKDVHGVHPGFPPYKTYEEYVKFIRDENFKLVDKYKIIDEERRIMVTQKFKTYLLKDMILNKKQNRI